MKILIFSMLLMPSVAFSMEYGILMRSYHAPDSDTTNDKTVGIFIQENNIQFAAFKNSFNNDTVMIGYTFEKFFINKHIRFGLTCGGVYGYHLRHDGFADGDKYGKQVLPYIVPTFSVGVWDTYINTHITWGAVTWSISHKF